MIHPSSNAQKISLFLGLIVALELLLLMLPIEAGTAMFAFIPLVATLIMLLITGEFFSKAAWKSIGLHRLGKKALLPAFLVPIIPIAFGYSLVWLTGLGTFGLNEEYQGKEQLLVFGFFITFIITALTVTLGEEVGWRGYLASHLKQFGMTKALLLNGFIWGLFHLAIILFTSVYHADVNLLLYVPLFMATVTLAGAFITYLRYITDSVWPAIIAHTSHNLIWNYGELLTQSPSGVVTYVTGDAGLVLIIFYFILFLWIRKQETPYEFKEQPTAINCSSGHTAVPAVEPSRRS